MPVSKASVLSAFKDIPNLDADLPDMAFQALADTVNHFQANKTELYESTWSKNLEAIKTITSLAEDIDSVIEQLNVVPRTGTIVPIDILRLGFKYDLKGFCETPGKNIYALDTGCLWGGELTAMKLGKKKHKGKKYKHQFFNVNC